MSAEERPPALTGNIEAETTPKTEGQMVIDTLKLFQEEVSMLKKQIATLDVRVNKELPAQLDAAFNEITSNFKVIGENLRRLGTPATTSPLTAAAGQGQQQGGFMGFIQDIFKNITGGGSAPAGGLSDMDKEILRTTKQIQMIALKDVLKKTAKNAGVEIVDHIVLAE